MPTGEPTQWPRQTIYNTSMTTVYLGLGSNLGDRTAMLADAIDAIGVLPDTAVVDHAPVYETPPMGPQDQGPYLNTAACIKTLLAPDALIAQLQAIETHLGRQPREDRRHWGPRPIDIDLLLYDDRVIDKPGLSVPHPGMHERWFVLRPLADIAPQLLHPVLGKTVAELLAAMESPVRAEEAAN